MAPSQPTIFMGKATAPSQELGVGGIPTVVGFGGIQLVWHLVLLSSKKLVRLPWRASLQSISWEWSLFPSVFLHPHPKFIQPLCRSHHLPLLDCALSCVTEKRGETGDQLSMKDPNLNTREVVPHSTCGAQTVRL